MILLVLSDPCFFNEEFSDFALYHWEIVFFSMTYLLLFFNEEFSDFALYHWEIVLFSLRYLLLSKGCGEIVHLWVWSLGYRLVFREHIRHGKIVYF